MSYQSCLLKPTVERFRYFSQSHIDYCEGNVCAAGLIDFFAQWHNRKVEELIALGNPNKKGTALYQYHSLKDLRIALVCMFATNTIRKALRYLIEVKGIVTRHANPKFKFDKTTHYLFYPEKFNDWVKNYVIENDSNQPAVLEGQPLENFVGEATSTLINYGITTAEALEIKNSGSKMLNFFPIQEELTDIGEINEENSKNNFHLSNLHNGKCKSDSIDNSNLHYPLCKFDNSIYNKNFNKTQQQPTTTARDFSKLCAENKNLVGLVDFDKTQNTKAPILTLLNTTAFKLEALAVNSEPVLSALKQWTDRIGEILTDIQFECLQHVVNTLSKENKISNPKEISKEIEFALLDKATLNRCHYSFEKKLKVIAELIEKNRWTTPARLQNSKNQSSIPIHVQDNKVVYLHESKPSELKQHEYEIGRIEAEIYGNQQMLDLFKDTPTFQQVKKVLEKKITEYYQQLQHLIMKRKALMGNQDKLKDTTNINPVPIQSLGKQKNQNN